jgi:mannose-6-phosphate isomerase-like protein (cupin superfamily)
MSQARHPKPPEVADLSIEDIAKRYVARFRDRKPDWNAFEDARIEGYKRAQHRFIGAGGSGKHGDAAVIPPRGFTLSIMYVEPGQGNAAHTHEVEEVFFVLQGFLTVFLEDDSGKRVDVRLGAWECISCPPGVILPSHAGQVPPRNDGLRGRRALQAAQRASERARCALTPHLPLIHSALRDQI